MLLVLSMQMEALVELRFNRRKDKFEAPVVVD